MKHLSLAFAILLLVLVLQSTKPSEAGRALHQREKEDDEWMKKENDLLLLSQERGPVTPTGPNPGSHIPSPHRSSSSTITERGFAGHAIAMPPPPPPPPPSFPRGAVLFGVAEN